MPIGDIVRVDVNYTFQNNPNTWCTFWETQTAAPVDTEPVSILDLFFGSLQPALEVIMSNQITFDCLVAQVIDPLPAGLPVVRNRDAVGALDSTELPGNVNAVVQTLEGIVESPPRKRGRDFWPGASVLEQVEGFWTQGYANLILDFYIAEVIPLLTDTNEGAYEWGNYSFTQRAENADPQFMGNGGTVPDPPTFGNDPFTEITLVRMVRACRTQRRRQPLDPCQPPYESTT